MTAPDAQVSGDLLRKALAVSTTVVALIAVAQLMALGQAPEASASGQDVVDWAQANGTGIKWFVWLVAVSTPFYAAMTALQAMQLPQPHRLVYLLGAALLVVTANVQAWIWGALAFGAGTIHADTARALLDVAIFWGPVLTGTTVTMMFPVVHAALAGLARLPAWLGYVGIAVIAEQLIETITIFGTTGFTAPGGAMNMQLGALATLVFLLSFSFCVVRQQVQPLSS